MKSLISRESYRAEQRYSGVYHIQGSMVTDADLDERSRITQDRTDHLGDDTIKDGVPKVGGAVAIGENNALSLQEGIIYADGVRGVLTAIPGANLNSPLALFSNQADLLQGPALPNTTDQIIYADIWDRPVYPLEDPYLADVGLHGAVTAFRTRTMTQLKAAPLSVLPDIQDGTGAFPKIGTGKLTVTPLNAVILADECDPCADVVSAEQIIANSLWRLEVIDVTGTPNAPGTITLAWSIENAAAIATADVNHEDFERTGKVYEFFSEITEGHLGVFADPPNAKRSTFVDDLSTTPTPATDHNGQPWPFVRRWDGQAVINTSTATVTSTKGNGFQISAAGQTVTLRIEAFEVELDLAGVAVVAGDYWLVELRRFAAESDQVRLVKETPVGVIHHYCTLFRVDTSGAILPPTDAEIRKLSFPTLSNLPATHVGFDNTCPKLYADAENVQQALDHLCDISADDIRFQSNCPELYDDAQDVQAALDALCKIDFSIHASFRLLFDWGVLCGIIPSLVKRGTDQVKITGGAFIDRSGKITRFEGGMFDISELKFKEGILFANEQALITALGKGEACLALAAQNGGKVTLHVVPASLAYGPDDPGFLQSIKNCLNEKEIINIDDFISKLPAKPKAVGKKILVTSSSEGALSGSAKLTEAEAKEAAVFNERLLNAFQKKASKEETERYKERVQEAIQNNPIGNTQGTARQIRQMQQANAVFQVFLRSDEERLRRCVCEALFPKCPPDLGKAPFLVPIACLRGKYSNDTFLLEEVCPFCCRKQAMTWRSLQYFIGESREKVAKTFAQFCCGSRLDDDGGDVKPKTTIKYDPGKYTNITFADLNEEYHIAEAFTGRPPKLPTEQEKKITVNDLSEADAKKTLLGNGIEITQTIDVDDDEAIKIIQESTVGVSETDQLISAGFVRPGDKVGLLLQNGVARGYVLLERGSGKLPFPTKKAFVSKEDEVKAKELIDTTNTAKGELADLVSLREMLSENVIKLKTDVETLDTEREKSVAAVKEVEAQLAELAKARTKITKEIEKVNKELESAEENRKTIILAVRENQPVTVVTGNKNPELVTKLAGVGITTLSDVAKLTTAKIKELVDAGILKDTAARKLKRDAEAFLKR
ncbi:MAG: hypothetical protein NPIRA02_09650 [Nitrospirales bacterium]|nr:MAG: hypothetical protein NPIRA02_09650 [Nitrospirales bacterium]